MYLPLRTSKLGTVPLSHDLCPRIRKIGKIVASIYIGMSQIERQSFSTLASMSIQYRHSQYLSYRNIHTFINVENCTNAPFHCSKSILYFSLYFSVRFSNGSLRSFSFKSFTIRPHSICQRSSTLRASIFSLIFKASIPYRAPSSIPSHNKDYNNVRVRQRYLFLSQSLNTNYNKIFVQKQL